MCEPKTLEEHRTYLHEITRLQLWYLWHLLHIGGTDGFTHALRNRIDLYRKLDMNAEGLYPRAIDWEHPDWQQVEERLYQVYLIHKYDPTGGEFEAAAFAVLRPQLDARVARDFADPSRLDGYTYGSIRFDAPGTDNPARVSIHIANAIAPRSLFADPAYLPACLRETMDRAARDHGATEMGTFTWLNSYPRWLALFPPEWQQHLSPANDDVMWHYGYWGQFITARGTFHADRARRLRATGNLPYPPRYAWCTFAALREHLAKTGD